MGGASLGGGMSVWQVAQNRLIDDLAGHGIAAELGLAVGGCDNDEEGDQDEHEAHGLVSGGGVEEDSRESAASAVRELCRRALLDPS